MASRMVVPRKRGAQGKGHFPTPPRRSAQPWLRSASILNDGPSSVTQRPLPSGKASFFGI